MRDRGIGILVAGQFSGEMFSVSGCVVSHVVKRWNDYVRIGSARLWSRRNQTILDLLMAGF